MGVSLPWTTVEYELELGEGGKWEWSGGSEMFRKKGDNNNNKSSKTLRSLRSLRFLRSLKSLLLFIYCLSQS